MMRNRRITAIGLVMALLATLGFAGCGGGEAVAKPVLTVTQAPLYGSVGEDIALPAATAQDGRDGDVSASIRVEIYAEEGEKKAEFSGSAVHLFHPDAAGTYVARYRAVNSAGLYSDTVEVNITVGEAPDFVPGKPVITVDCGAVTFTALEEVTLRAAEGKTSDGADISAEILVRVLNSDNEEVFSGAGDVSQTVAGLASGTYTVEYTLAHGEARADSKRYTLTVVTGGGQKPLLTAPVAAVTVYEGERVEISPPNAKDHIEGDLSERAEYRIENADGSVLQEKRPAVERAYYTFSQAGEYRVIYSAANRWNVAADETGFAVRVLPKKPAGGGIALDGAIDEEEYLSIPAYRCGMGGNVALRFYADASGLAIGATVADANLIRGKDADAEARLNLSDGLEFLFHPQDTAASVITGLRSFRIRVGVDGTVKSYIANTVNDQWSAGSMDLTALVCVRAEGTLSVNKETAEGAPEATDTDRGYAVELKLPWSYFGYGACPWEDAGYGKDYIRFAFGHRDVKSTQVRSDFRQISAADFYESANNCFYNGMNVQDRPKVASEGLNPNLYSRLYLNGGALGVNPVSFAEEVVLDGFMENSFWKDAEEVPFGSTDNGAEVAAKVKLTNSGVFAGVWIADGQIVAEARSFLNNYGVFCNDSVDLRLVAPSELERNSLVSPNEDPLKLTDSKIFAFDPLGSAFMQMLQPVGQKRTHMQQPFSYGVMADGTVGHAKRCDNWNENNLFIADTGIGDEDRGWGVEVFVPWETLNMARPDAGGTVTVGLLLTVYDRNADPTGTGWKANLVTKGGSVRSRAGEPNTYFRVTRTF